jgi:hypothetical protein
VATVEVRADFVPMPRCLVVRHDQRLQVTNATGGTLDVSVGTHLRASIHDGDTYTTPDAIGRDLAPGVHRLRITSASAADLWVDAVCQGPGATSCVTP